MAAFRASYKIYILSFYRPNILEKVARSAAAVARATAAEEPRPPPVGISEFI